VLSPAFHEVPDPTHADHHQLEDSLKPLGFAGVPNIADESLKASVPLLQQAFSLVLIMTVQLLARLVREWGVLPDGVKDAIASLLD